MKKKLLLTLATLLLIILPFLIGDWIGKYSPYVETNSFQTYVIICASISIVLVLAVLLLSKYFHRLFDKISVGGSLLFLLASPIVGISGLAAAPDLSLKMLDHPEREHLRYIFLFIAAMLFGVFVLLLLRNNLLKIKNPAKWVIAALLTIAFAEFIWEFNHHYSYPEALKQWVSQGKDAGEFVKYYDNFNIITIGVIGRYCQFLSIIWLSLQYYKLRQIKIWSPIISTIFGLMGIVSATVIFITEMNLPKGFEFLFLFFIPGIPFILLYWLGVALVTKFKKSEITA